MARTSRFVAAALSLVLVAALLSGCAEREAGGQRTEVLVIGTTDSATTLDPAEAYDYFSSNVLNNVSETLITYEPGTSKIVPGLAMEWNVSDDGKTYVFKIREGVKFHDGAKLDAEAVKFSLDRARTLRGDPSFLLDNITEVEVTGDYEVTVRLDHPSSPFLSKLGYTVAAIVSPEAYSAEEFMPTNVVGTGPYKLKEWVEGDHITLLKNEDYWGDAAYADKVVVKFYQKSSSLKLAVEQGEVDVGYRTFTPLEKKALKSNDELNTWEIPSPYIRYLVINVTKSPFDDPAVRRAVAYAIDRAAIDEQVFQGTVTPLYSMVPDGMWSYKPVFKERYGEGGDIEAALKELKKAGYSKDKPLSFTLWYTPTHYGDTEDELAQVLKSQLEATGAMKVELASSEWGRYTDDLVEGSMGILLLGWYPDYFDPDDYLTPFLSTEGAKSLGSFYDNKRMNDMLTEQVQLVEKEDRTPVLHDIQELLAEDCPNIPLYQGTQFAVAQGNVKGIILGPLQIFRYYTIYKE